MINKSINTHPIFKSAITLIRNMMIYSIPLQETELFTVLKYTVNKKKFVS